MERKEIQGVTNPLLDSEKTAVAEQVSSDAAHHYVVARIEHYQVRAQQLVKQAQGSLAEPDQTEWRHIYEVLDFLYDELSKLPTMEQEILEPDVVTDITSVEQLGELYADDHAEFPRLSKQAVEAAFRLYAHTETINSVVLLSGNDVMKIGSAIAQVASHKQDALRDPGLLRGPVIHQLEDGTLLHYRYGVEIRRQA